MELLVSFRGPRKSLRGDAAESLWRLYLTEGSWDAYTRGFVETYDLTEEQRATARSVRDELKSRAREHEKILAKPEPTSEEAKKVDRPAREAAKKRVHELFEELRKRLDAIPTRAQRERGKAKLPDSVFKTKGEERLGLDQGS